MWKYLLIAISFLFSYVAVYILAVAPVSITCVDEQGALTFTIPKYSFNIPPFLFVPLNELDKVARPQFWEPKFYTKNDGPRKMLW